MRGFSPDRGREMRRRIADALPFRIAVKMRVKRPRSRAFVESDANVRADAYLDWICRVVGGWLDSGSGNLRAMDHAIRHMPEGGSVLEIGSFLGASLNVLSYLTLKWGRSHRVVSCDPWDFECVSEPIGGFFDASTAGYRDYVRETFVKNVSMFSAKKLPYTVEAYADDFFEDWRAGKLRTDVFGREVTLGGPLCFAYIDGNHSYEASMSDFRNVDEQLLRGGFVLFDDSEDRGTFESTRTAQEAAAHPGYELVFKAPNYLLRKR